ncbi:MAG: DEAD/DEAH box helicase [Treponema sp.]|nr:DEAD/DEAH box helicase [Treponema sp.]
MSDFKELGIDGGLVEKLAALGITEPTAVQKQTIPQIMAGKNVIFQSATGSGKTFAFFLPILQKIQAQENPTKAVQLVVVSPTFELASQLKQAAASVTDLKCGLFIGGVPLKRQIDALKEKPSIIIGTVSRLLELCRLKKLKIDKAAALVLDEADRLASKEIVEETSEFIELFGAQTQIVACSATITKKTQNFLENSRASKAQDVAGGNSSKAQDAGAALGFETILLPLEDVLREKIEHWAFFAERRDKIDFVRSFLRAFEPKKALVFTSRADQVENICQKLKFKKIDCAALTTKIKNQERQSILAHFKNGKCPILVTSDLSSRGLDIPDIDCVIQCDLPPDEDFFVHRAGRTARAGKKGVNVVVGDEWELRKLAALEKKLKIVVRPKALYKGKICAADQAQGAK